jgi:integrase
MASVRKRSWGDKSAWVVDYIGSGGRERKQFSTKKAADAFRIKVEGQIQAGTYRPGSVAMGEACQRFLGHCEGRHSRDERMTRKMLLVYRGHIKNYIEPGLGNRRLSQLTTGAVGNFKDRLRTDGVSVPTTRKIISTLHGVLEYARSQDWVATNVAQGVKVIGTRAEGSKKITPPSKAAMLAILAAAGDDLKLKLIFAASTGARAGEQWAARWEDADLEAGELHIRRRVDAWGDEGAPKSTAGVRTVPLSAQLVAMLRAWKLRSPHSKATDLIFPNRRGGHIGHDNLVKREFLPLFGRAMEEEKQRGKEGGPPSATRFNWHALRHFAVSTWIEAGLTPKAVQTFAGHASLAITMDRYGHLFPSEDHRQAMDRIARLFENTE